MGAQRVTPAAETIQGTATVANAGVGSSAGATAAGGLALIAGAVLLLSQWAGTFGLSVNNLTPQTGSGKSAAIFSGDAELPEVHASTATTAFVLLAAGALLVGLFRRAKSEGLVAGDRAAPAAKEVDSQGQTALGYMGQEASKLIAAARRPSSTGSLDVLDGARAIAMLLVVCFHCLSTPLTAAGPDAEGGMSFVRLWCQHGMHSIIKHGDLLGVECFLVASGVVTGRSLLRAGGSGKDHAAAAATSLSGEAGGPSPASTFLRSSAAVAAELRAFCWQKWLRLAPPVFVVVALHGLLDPGSCTSCTSPASWWRIALFLNNHAEHWTACSFHTWYCALQMQLYVVGAPLVILLRHLTRSQQAMPSRKSSFIDISDVAESSTATGGAAFRRRWSTRLAWFILAALFAAAVASRAVRSRFEFSLSAQTLVIRCPAFLIGIAVALAMQLDPCLGKWPRAAAAASTSAGAGAAPGLPLPAVASSGSAPSVALVVLRGSRFMLSHATDALAVAVVIAAAWLGNQDESGDFEFQRLAAQGASGSGSSASGSAGAFHESLQGWALRVFMPPALDAAMGWILLALLQGRLRVLSSVLGWRWWRPMAAISYSGFLVQFLLINRTYFGFWPSFAPGSSAAGPSSPFMPRAGDSEAALLLRSSGLMAVSVPTTLALGLLFYLAFEAPVRDLLKPASSTSSAASEAAVSAGPRRALLGSALVLAALCVLSLQPASLPAQ